MTKYWSISYCIWYSYIIFCGYLQLTKNVNHLFYVFSQCESVSLCFSFVISTFHQVTFPIHLYITIACYLCCIPLLKLLYVLLDEFVSSSISYDLILPEEQLWIPGPVVICIVILVNPLHYRTPPLFVPKCILNH